MSVDLVVAYRIQHSSNRVFTRPAWLYARITQPVFNGLIACGLMRVAIWT